MENMPREHSAMETSCIRFAPTNQSLYTENSHTDDGQDNDGMVAASSFDRPDMQLSVVYWV